MKGILYIKSFIKLFFFFLPLQQRNKAPPGVYLLRATAWCHATTDAKTVRWLHLLCNAKTNKHVWYSYTGSRKTFKIHDAKTRITRTVYTDASKSTKPQNELFGKRYVRSPEVSTRAEKAIGRIRNAKWLSEWEGVLFAKYGSMNMRFRFEL